MVGTSTLFPDADRVDIHRQMGHDVSLGYGVDFCFVGPRTGVRGHALKETLRRLPAWSVDLELARVSLGEFKLRPGSLGRVGHVAAARRRREFIPPPRSRHARAGRLASIPLDKDRARRTWRSN
jgi:hypothetical protein